MSQNRKPRVLINSLFHPEIVPGGAQQVAYELFSAADEDDAVDAYLLAAIDPVAHRDLVKSGAFISGFDGRANEFLFWGHGFDAFWQKLTNPKALERYLEFVSSLQPDVVHFHHSLLFGVELLAATRRALPDSKILYTFHEFIPICHANGQMVTKDGRGLCSEASPYRCHRCFPSVTADAFLARKQWLLAHFEAVDHFITPTQFVKQRYVDWGIPEARITPIQNGQINRNTVTWRDRVQARNLKRNKFGFFGQILDNKGIHVLLDASRILLERGYTDFSVEIFGGNIEFATPAYRQEIKEKSEGLAEMGFKGLRWGSAYGHDELPVLMQRVDWVVVPSVWWEVFGLVVSEAWMFGRPVIASDIGGLRERITHGKNGLLFPVADSRSLADTMMEVLKTPAIWTTLNKNCTAQNTAEDMWVNHKRLLEIQ